MRAGVLPRSALLLVDLGLLAGLAGLFGLTFLGSGPVLLGVAAPRQLAIESDAGVDRDPARWAIVARQIDRYRPPPTPPPPPQVEEARIGLEAAWDLLCVLIDPANPRRCSAIVGPAASGSQASIGPGDRFQGGEVLGVELEAAGASRRARVRVRYPHGEETLELRVDP